MHSRQFLGYKIKGRITEPNLDEMHFPSQIQS